MSLKHDTAYNLLGSLVPMVVGVITVPMYLHVVGEARYGVLAIVWLFLGYFGVFDPGITRAALFHIARLSKAGQEKERESVFLTALVVNLAFGIIGGIVLYLAARPLFMSTFKMPESMRGEVLAVVPWLAASVPISILSGVLGGALQARDAFASYNIIYAGNAIASQLVPLTVAVWHGPDLTWLIPAILITRTCGALPSLFVIVRSLPMGVGGAFQMSLVKSLFSYGGWVTVTNLINPALVSMDRMLIGSVLGAQAVTTYTVPFNLVARVSILPGALSTSLFPRLSRESHEDSGRIAAQALFALGGVMTPLIIAGIALLPAFMRLWIGTSLAHRAAPIGVILLAGIWMNSLAFIPYEHLQALDRPDLSAKFHAAEIVPFLAILWVALHFFGVIGAAWAWTMRVSVDTILLFAVAGKIPDWPRVIPGGLLVVLAIIAAPSKLLSLKSLMETIIFAASLVWSWQLSPFVRSVLASSGRIKSTSLHIPPDVAQTP